MSNISCFDDIKHAYYINLERRVDRKEHVINQFNKLGLPVSRFNAIQMKNGAIGCSMSHLKLLQTGVLNDFEHMLIVEDDIKFLDPALFKTQFNKFIEAHGNNWDVILFAGNNVPPYTKIDDTCIKVTRCQTTTGYLVNGHYIKTLMQNVKQGLTNLLNRPDDRKQFAIDIFWFNLQFKDKWFLITPLTVVQREDYSDIEERVVNYEHLMVDLDKEAMIRQQMAIRQHHQQQQQFGKMKFT
jgi:glycosyl transferase family 25